MRDERRFGHPMKDNILQMPRDAFPAPHAISDDDAEGREDAGAEKLKICRPLGIRGERPARRPHGRAAGHRLPARIEDVGLQAHRAAEDPRHRDRETAACQERRARRDAPRHGQRHLIGTSMAARLLARDTHHIATTPGLDAPSRSPRHLPSRADCGKNATRATEGVTRQWQQPNRPSRRFLSRTSTPSRTWRRSYR